MKCSPSPKDPPANTANAGDEESGVAAEADAPVPPRGVRSLLHAFEACCWLVCAVVLGSLAVGAVLIVRGTVMETARVLEDGPIAQLGAGAVDGGFLDVTLTDVPLEVSWPYLACFLTAGAAWLLLVVLVARLAGGLRRGRPFGGVRPVSLFVFAGVWTVLSFAVPMVMGDVRPAMAQAAGVSIPGATFSYAMTFEDLSAFLAGPLLAVAVGVLVTGSRLWHEQRTLV